MKFTLIIDDNAEDEIIARVKAQSKLTEQIRQICEEDSLELIGSLNDTVKQLDIGKVYCFTVEENRIFAHTEEGKYQVKKRLYQLECELGNGFVRINQSCLANIRMIEHFEASFVGTLVVVFGNGHRDYVSRRNLKAVKERFGL